MVLTLRDQLVKLLIMICFCRCRLHEHTKCMLETLGKMDERINWRKNLKDLENCMMCGLPVIHLDLPLWNLMTCVMQKMPLTP